MSKKKKHPHGHYCKICREYKANEKFSGKGHAIHICKSCSRLNETEKAAAMDMNRLMSFPMRRLSDRGRRAVRHAGGRADGEGVTLYRAYAGNFYVGAG